MRLLPLSLAATLIAAPLIASAASAQTTQSNGTAAASGNSNQAVATTGADAPQPAHGANSFSHGQAVRRIESHGFQKVVALHKDGNGIWWGQGTRDGQQVRVWLDYKGNVGQQQ